MEDVAKIGERLLLWYRRQSTQSFQLSGLVACSPHGRICEEQLSSFDQDLYENPEAWLQEDNIWLVSRGLAGLVIIMTRELTHLKG